MCEMQHMSETVRPAMRKAVRDMYDTMQFILSAGSRLDELLSVRKAVPEAV